MVRAFGEVLEVQEVGGVQGIWEEDVLPVRHVSRLEGEVQTPEEMGASGRGDRGGEGMRDNEGGGVPISLLGLIS